MTQDPAQAAPRDPDADGRQRDEQRVIHSQPTTDAKDEVPLSDTTQIQAPLQVPREKRSFEDVYSDRLKVIWDAAHSPGQEHEEEWQIFHDAMLRVAQAMPLVDGDFPSISFPGRGIEGNLVTVDLIVRDGVRREASPPALVALLNEALPPTMARLEREGQGTPERRVDIIVRVISELAGAPGVSELARESFRHLQTQDPNERGPGFYVTVANLAGVVALDADRDRQLQAAFMYHIALRGVWSISMAEGLDESVRTNSGVVGVSAFNLASIVSDLLQREEKDQSEESMTVLRDLKTISASWIPLVQLDNQRAAQLTEALGFETDQPVEFATVLQNLGTVARVWDNRLTATARLSAAGGTIDAATPEPENPSSMFFNAGVMLIRSNDDSTPLLLSRMLINALGLRLALTMGPDLVVSLVELAGLDLAVNLVGAFVDYRAVGDPEVTAGVEPLVRKLVSLIDWSPLRATQRDVNVDLGRLAVSARELGIASEEAIGTDLPQSLSDAIDVLRRSTGAASAQDDLIVDTAQLIGHIFGAIMPSAATSGLEQTVEAVAAGRQRPVDVLIQRYERYASPLDDRTGTSPLVVAGVLEASDWERLAARLLEPVRSIAPALRAFQLR